MGILKVLRRVLFKRCNVSICIHYAGGYCTCCREGCELFERQLFQEH